MLVPIMVNLLSNKSNINDCISLNNEPICTPVFITTVLTESLSVPYQIINKRTGLCISCIL